MQQQQRTEQSIENLPIDISSTKLLDWLIDRRHVERKWQAAALVIREKINNAIQDMPAVEEITNLVSGSYINYFHCVRIVELLKVSEASSKNIFGMYSSQRMKDWQEIVKLYEKNNVYLAEVADMLIRNINYEVPALKKQIAKCQQIRAECEKKERDYVSSASNIREEYNSRCKQLGIEGVHIRRELMTLVQDLPSFYDQLVEKTKALSTACEYYHAFVQFVLGCGEERAPTTLPMLAHIQRHGNTTVYQWRTGQQPASIREIKMDAQDQDSDVDKDEIDWGDIEVEEPEGGAGGISYDIQVEEPGQSAQPSSEDGVATGTDAFTILDHPPTRDTFTNELLELEGFLRQRLGESGGGDGGDILASSQLQSAPTVVQLQNSQSLGAMLGGVSAILTQLTAHKIHHLLLVRGSPKYVDKLCDELKQKLETAEKMMASKEAVMEKCREKVEEQSSLEPKIDLLVQRTRELQKQIENEISKKYKNRPVNLVGAINTI